MNNLIAARLIAFVLCDVGYVFSPLCKPLRLPVFVCQLIKLHVDPSQGDVFGGRSGGFVALSLRLFAYRITIMAF
jgi:hypothetical protein